ncbi:CBS-domain-containing protein [Rhizophagus clarus]|uniref:CBS-domain-containing protein n=1 Tax=Rhizophagus clarus TaxID=94130 RepID=A0A8H3LQ07_9GLOM|nr:CBS-domain-containing protein [Rhizophagus clarus]
MSAQNFRPRKTSSPSYPTPAQSHSGSSEVGSPSDGIARQRMSKKDEAIRKKVEHELNKKNRTKSTSLNNRGKPQRQVQGAKGTVASLNPSQALTVRESALVVEASQLMAAKRADCVLVIDSDEHLSGIFTAKDLAFRVVGDGLDARTTTVATIMTRNPMCVKNDTSATDALNTMVARGFRHLPVCNEEGDVVGLLDITKCLYEALDKMERAYGSSKKLYDALEGVEREWSTNQPTQILQYMEMLREKMACPDLSSVLDGSMPAEVGVKTSVRDAARLMREYRTTAVLVMEHHSIAGIFTSKDIVLRVIAAGLDPSTCSVIRVMTPHPDTAPPQTSILDALKKMYDGHYLNLPVVDGGSILGMVDVLKLTYATMEQMYSMQNQENDSIAPSQSVSNIPPPSPNSRARGSGNISPIPEIHPSESASALDDGSMASFPRGHDENFFTFKFKAPNGKSHRFTVDYTSFEHIRATVASKLPSSIRDFTISYVDEDDDHVSMSNDDDVVDAVRIAQRQGMSRVILHIQEIEKKSSRYDYEDDDEDYDDFIDKKRRRRRSGKHAPDYSLPIPHDLLLPGAVLTLAVAIIGVRIDDLEISMNSCIL